MQARRTGCWAQSARFPVRVPRRIRGRLGPLRGGKVAAGIQRVTSRRPPRGPKIDRPRARRLGSISAGEAREDRSLDGAALVLKFFVGDNFGKKEWMGGGKRAWFS